MRSDLGEGRSAGVHGSTGGRRRRAPRRGYRATAEVLEGRQLLAVAIAEIPLPVAATTFSTTWDITGGPDGNVWFSEPTGKIGKVTPSGTVTEFPVPGDGLLGQMTAGSDGNVWFLSNPPPGPQEPLRVGRITPDGDVTLFDLPGSDPATAIATGPDGNLWVAAGSRIDRVTAAGDVTEFALPDGVRAIEIIAGPDGNLWFTESTNQLGTITTGGGITTAAADLAGSRILGSGFVLGPDGSFWVTVFRPAPFGGPLGYLDRVTPDGNVTEVFLRHGPAGSLAVGADGNFWVADPSGQVIRYTPDGTPTVFRTPTSGGQPGAITSGPDGNLWFTENFARRIGQVVLNAPDPAPLVADAAPPISATAGAPVTGPLASFTPSNPGDTADDYEATIDWGDGSTGRGFIVPDGQGRLQVGAPHTYNTAGTFHPVVTILDVHVGSPGASAVVSATINVAEPRLQPQPFGNLQFRGTPGPFVVAYATHADTSSTYTATIDWGDGSTSAGTVSLHPELLGPPPQSTWSLLVTGFHVYAADGSYHVRTTITDEAGNSTVAESVLQYMTPLVYRSHSVNVEGRPGVPTGANIPDSPAQPGVGPLSTVGVFFVSGTNVSPRVFSGTIDWGDGSGPTPAIVTAEGPDGFYVSGVHTYAKVGTYRLRATFSGFGIAWEVAGEAHITAPPLGFSGILDPASDTGDSRRDGITADATSRFTGAATPGTTVELLATAAGAGSGRPFSIGKTVVGPSGLWSITSVALPEGAYTIAANQTAADGRGRQGIPVRTGGPGGRLVVDTTGPRITGAVLDPTMSRVALTFEDNLSRVSPLGLLGRGSTLFGRVLPRGVSPVPTRVTSAGSGGAVLGLGHPVPRGRYVLRVASGGLHDVAGNALDGEFRGTFPTGDRRPGGDFLARFVTSGDGAVPAQAVPAGSPQAHASRAPARSGSRLRG